MQTLADAQAEFQILLALYSFNSKTITGTLTLAWGWTER